VLSDETSAAGSAEQPKQSHAQTTEQGFIEQQQGTPAEQTAADEKRRPYHSPKPTLPVRIYRWLVTWWTNPFRPRGNFAEHLTVVVSIAIAVIAVFQYHVYRQQKEIMESSGEQTNQLIAAQKKIANLQYAAGSPNVRFAYFTLRHEPDGKVWGWVRVRNNGIKYPADFVTMAVNLEFRRPSENERRNPGGFRDVINSPLQPFDPNKRDDQIGSIYCI
jgi:hypothetical protein